MRALLLNLSLAGALVAADPAITIYNQDFAVIRDTVPLDLHQGENRVTFQDVTGLLEPESVMLRDASGRVPFRIVEQNYRADPVSPDMLLSRFEGKTIQFLVPRGDRTETVDGKVIRAGSGTPAPSYQQNGPPQSPIIEVDGKLRFSLPGEPMFPALGNDTILKPSLNWIIAVDRSARLSAELAYVSRGMTWSADYNVISSPSRTDLDLIGWVTMQNNTGKTFDDARIKLMAGDVNKIKPNRGVGDGVIVMASQAVSVNGAPVTEKTFDEYHLYTLEHATTLHDRETKQVEFLRTEKVASQQIYVYDGLKLDLQRYNGWNFDMIRNDTSYGSVSNTKVRVMREFQNSVANHLGMPLPAGRLRFYQRDADGQLEFTGEDNIEHTPKDETVRVFTGNSFDLTGDRKRTNYRVDMAHQQADESFEIKVRNHKTQPVEIRVVEHLYRSLTWEVQLNSLPFTKLDAETIEFRVQLKPDEEKTVTYNAHYTW